MADPRPFGLYLALATHENDHSPDDYDDVNAGAPANNWLPLMTLSVLIERELQATGSLTAKLGVLRGAAIAACDGADGVVDSVITAPGTCAFDPASLQCAGDAAADYLTAEEVAAARSIYAGVVDAQGQVIMPGTGLCAYPESPAHDGAGEPSQASSYSCRASN